MPNVMPQYKRNELLRLLAYAETHAHSQLWIPALLTLLDRLEVPAHA